MHFYTIFACCTLIYKLSLTYTHILSLSLPLSHTHTHTHTHTYRPRTDTCKTCDTFRVQIEAEEDPHKKTLMQGEWDLHKRRAERAYHQLREDTALSQSDSNVELLPFGLWQAVCLKIVIISIRCSIPHILSFTSNLQT